MADSAGVLVSVNSGYENRAVLSCAPIDVEKLMLIFDALKAGVIKEMLPEIGADLRPEDIVSTFKKCADNLLKRGLEE